jgi:uncharacterized membrane protein (DUF2068 family)
MDYSDTGLLKLIAVFKLLKTIALIATGIAALKVVHADVGTVLETTVLKFGFDPGSNLLNHAIQRACEIPQDKIWELGAISFVYAALFLTEGTGLWLGKRWAEWFTVIITGSLIPFEVYEAIHRPDFIRIVVFLINVAVVLYLILRIVREPGSRRLRQSSDTVQLRGPIQ